jgi:hypothetical protein
LVLIKAKANAFDVKLKRIKINTAQKKGPSTPVGAGLSIKELQAKYNKGELRSTDSKIDRTVEIIEDEEILLEQKNEAIKREATFSQKELDAYAKKFEGFIQSCFDARQRALLAPEL